MRYTQRILAAAALAIVAGRVGAQELQPLPGDAAASGDLVPIGGEEAVEATPASEPAMETAEEPAVVEETEAAAAPEEELPSVETVSLWSPYPLSFPLRPLPTEGRVLILETANYGCESGG